MSAVIPTTPAADGGHEPRPTIAETYRLEDLARRVPDPLAAAFWQGYRQALTDHTETNQ